MIRQEIKRLFSSWMFRAVLIVSLLIPFLNSYDSWKNIQNDLEWRKMGPSGQVENLGLSTFAG